MAQNTSEYETIIEHFHTIALSIQNDLTQISSKLLTVGLLNQDQARAARSSSTAKEYRAAEVTDIILTRTQLDRNNYYKFIELLRKGGKTYGDLVKKWMILSSLKKTFNQVHYK